METENLGGNHERCQGLTRRNEQCRNTAPAGSRFCHAHIEKVSDAGKDLESQVGTMQNTTKSNIAWDSLWKTVSACLFTVVFVIAAAFFLAIVVSETIKNRIEIAPISMPKSLIELGNSPEVISERISDHIEGIFGKVSSSTMWKDMAVETNPPTIRIPGSEISARAISNRTRKLLSIESVQISGELMVSNSCVVKSRSPVCSPRLNEIVQNSDQSLEEVTISNSLTCIALRLRVSGTIVADLLPVPIDQLDTLLEEAAHCAVRKIDPYHFTYYLYDSNSATALEEAKRLTWEPSIGTDEKSIVWSMIGFLHIKDRNYIAAEQMIRRAQDISPKSARPLIHMGMLLNLQNRTAEAEQEARAAITLEPSHAPSHRYLGLLLQNKNNFSEAEQRYRTAIDLDSSYAAPYNNLGILFLEQGRLVEAEQQYRLSLEIDPRYAPAHNNLGNLLSNQGNLIESEIEYLAAINIDPDYVPAHNGLGSLLEKQGESVAAEKRYLKALESKTLESYSMQAYTYQNLGDLKYKQGKKKEAEKNYRTALEINPRLDSSLNSLGILLRSEGSFEEAEKMYRAAINVEPNNAVAHTNLGNLLIDLNQPKKAKQEYYVAIEINPNHAAAYNGLGGLLKTEGNTKDAEENFRMSIKVNPNYSFAYSNLAYLLGETDRVEEAKKMRIIADELTPESD